MTARVHVETSDLFVQVVRPLDAAGTDRGEPIAAVRIEWTRRCHVDDPLRPVVEQIAGAVAEAINDHEVTR